MVEDENQFLKLKLIYLSILPNLKNYDNLGILLLQLLKHKNKISMNLNKLSLLKTKVLKNLNNLGF